MTRLHWGLYLPHGGADEFQGWSGADAWARLREVAKAADELGYDHLWMSDHLMASGGDRSGPYFESYATLAALGQITRHAQLGALATSAFYRSVAILAKQAATVDVSSGGRLILALGGGWDAEECAAFGIPFPTPRERVEIFAETLEAIRRLWSEPSVDFDGTHVHLHGARCDPHPLRTPPIWTGTHGPRGLRVAARLADVANFNAGLEEFRRLSGELYSACTALGKPPDSVGTSVYRLADLSGSDATMASLLARLGAPADALEALRADHFIGTPEQVIPQVQAFVDAGASHIIILCPDAANSMTSIERFMSEVVPHIRPPAGVTSPG